jgi:hypothetical protein
MAGVEDQLIALHATVVETACASETKRQSVSVTSAGLISAGAALAASNQDFIFIYIVIPVMVVSAIWFVTVRFYKQLANAKWAVVHEIERELPFAPFRREWELYKGQKARFTFGPSTLEQVVPALIFIASSAYGLIWLGRILIGLCHS